AGRARRVRGGQRCAMPRTCRDSFGQRGADARIRRTGGTWSKIQQSYLLPLQAARSGAAEYSDATGLKCATRRAPSMPPEYQLARMRPFQQGARSVGMERLAPESCQKK